MRSIGLRSFALLLLTSAFSVSSSDAQVRITFTKTASLDVTLPAGSGPQGIALADVNRDGRPDIIAVNSDSGEVALFLNTGGGQFEESDTGPNAVDGGPVAVATGDFNRDGIVDIVTVNRDDPRVSVFLGDPDADPGDFSDVEAMENSDVAVPAVGVVVDNFNSDGALDLAVLTDGAVYLLSGNSSNPGTFTPFTPSSTATGGNGGFAIAKGSLNTKTDTYADLAISNKLSDTVSVLLGNGDGTFQAARLLQAGDHTQDLITADLNADGSQDIAVVLERTGAEPDNNVSILYGNGDGTFQGAVRTTAEETSIAVAAADLDADTKIDMAVTNTSGGQGIDVLRNDPDAIYPDNQNGFAQVLVPRVAEAVAVQAGDINGDGKPDLVALSQDGASIVVLINTTGQPTAAPASPTPTPSAATPTRTRTPSPPPTSTPIPPTRTFTPTGPPPTKTATPPIVRISVGSAIGRPGDAVEVTVSLVTSGLSVAATGNDISFDAGVLNLSGRLGSPIPGATPTPPPCRIDPRIGKSLISSFDVGIARFFVVPENNTDPIPDGPLYSCTFRIAPYALPGSYAIRNTLAIAFTPAGTQLEEVVGSDGSVTVSLFSQSKTPSGTPNGGGGCSIHTTDSTGSARALLVILPALVAWGRGKFRKRFPSKRSAHSGRAAPRPMPALFRRFG